METKSSSSSSPVPPPPLNICTFMWDGSRFVPGISDCAPGKLATPPTIPNPVPGLTYPGTCE